MYNYIINPTTLQKISIFSNEGKKLLKTYTNNFIGGMNSTESVVPTTSTSTLTSTLTPTSTSAHTSTLTSTSTPTSTSDRTQYKTLRHVSGILSDHMSTNLSDADIGKLSVSDKGGVNDIDWENRLGMSIEDAFKEYLVPKTQHGNIETIIEKTLAENPVVTCEGLTSEKQRRACITFYNVQKAIQRKKKLIKALEELIVWFEDAIDKIDRECHLFFEYHGWDINPPSYVVNKGKALRGMQNQFKELLADIEAKNFLHPDEIALQEENIHNHKKYLLDVVDWVMDQFYE